MSKQIENNVVQMTFDNKQFEKNISTSTKSIENLNEELKFKDANKGFQDLEKYANSVNFDGLTKAIENINSVFTVTGALSKKIIDDIAGYFEEKIVGTVRKVRSTMGYIMDTNLGVQKYEQYTTAMNTLKSNMTTVDRMNYEAQKAAGAFDNEIEYIEMYMDKLLTFTDETSYSFTDMVDAIAKFSSSDVELDKATSAIMGIANVAAVAGQNASVATQSMQQLVQSFGTGYVKYEDWKQAFASKNMITKELKETLVQAAVGVTISEEDLKEAGYGTKANWADFFFTSDMLGQKWLDTSNVLVKGLSEYSKASDLILKNMEAIGGDTSVTDMLTWVEDFKEANKNGTLAAKDFAQSLKEDYNIEDVNLLAKTIETLSTKEYELSLKAFLAAQQATNFHEAIDATRDAVGTKMMKMLGYFIGDLDQARKLWTGFANSLWDIFAGPLDATLGGLKEFNKGVAETVEINGELVEITWYDKFWNGVSRAFSGIGSIINDFLDIIRVFAGAWEEVTDETGETTIEVGSIIEKYTFGFMKKITGVVNKIADAIEKFRNSTVMSLMLDIFKNLVEIISLIKQIIRTITSAVFGTALKNIHKPLTVILQAIKYITSAVSHFLKNVVSSSVFSKLITAIKNITSLCINLFTNVLKNAGSVLSKLIGYIKTIWDWLTAKLSPVITGIIDFFSEIGDSVFDTMAGGIDLVSDAFDWLIKKFKDAKDWFSGFIKEITGTDFNGLNEKLKNLGSGFIEGASGIGERTLDVVKSYASSVFDKNNPSSIPYLVNELKDADGAVEGAQRAITWMGDALSNPIKFVFDMVGAILNTDLSKASDLLCGFIKKVTDALASISPDIISFIGKVIDVLAWVVSKVIYLVGQVIQFASGTISTTGNGLLDTVLNAVLMILKVMLGAVIAIIDLVAKIAEKLSPTVEALLDYIGDFIGKIFDWIVDIARQISEMDATDLIKSAKTLLFITLGIFILIKVFLLISGILSTIYGLGGPIKKLSTGVFFVLDSASGLLDTLGGYNIPGMIMRIAILILSIGYAMSSIAKVAEGFANPEKQGAYFTAIAVCFLFFIGVIAAVKVLFTSLQKQAATLNLATNAFNVGPALLGVAAVIASTAFALAKLASVCDDSNTEAIEVAALSIIAVILAMGAFLKIVQGEGNSSTSTILKKGEGFNKQVQKSGTTYEGVAKAVKALAISLSLIMVAFAFLVKAVDKMDNPERLWQVFAVVEVLLASIGAFMVIMTKMYKRVSGESEGTKFLNKSGASFFESAGLVAFIYAITGFVIIVMAAITVCAAIVQASGIDADLFLIIAGVIAGIMLILGFVMKMVLSSFEEINNLGIKTLLKNIAKLVMVSVVFTSFAAILAVIAGAIATLTATIEASDALNDDSSSDDPEKASKKKGMSSFARALLTIVGILVLIWFFVETMMATADEIDFGSLGGVVLIILAMTAMIKVISLALIGLTTAFDILDPGAIIGAVVSLILIMGAVTAMMAVMMTIAKAMGGGTDSGAVILLAMAAAMFLFAKAILLLSESLAILAAVIEATGFWTMVGALAVLAVAMVGVIAFVAVLGALGVAFGPAIMSIGIGIGLITLAILALDLAIMLLIPAVDMASENLVGKFDKVVIAFEAIGAAISGALIGLVVGFVEGIAKESGRLILAILTFLNNVMKAITEWAYNPETALMIGEFIHALFTATVKSVLYFLALLLVSIGEFLGGIWNWLEETIFGPIFKGVKYLIKAVGEILKKGMEVWLAPFKLIIQWVRKLFGWNSPSTLFHDLGTSIMQGLLNGITAGWDWVVGKFQALADTISNIFNTVVDFVEDKMERALNGGKTKAELLSEELADKQEKLDTAKLTKRSQGYAEFVQEYMKLYKAINQGWYRNKSEEDAARKRLEELTSRSGSQYTYSIEGFKNLSNSEQKAIRDNLYELGYNTSAGFLQGLMGNGDPEKLGERYMNDFVDGNKKAADIHSPSGVMEGIGTNLIEGLKNGLNLDSLKDLGGEMMNSITSGFTDNMSGLTDATGDLGSMLNSDSLATNMDMSGYTTQFDMSGYNMDMSAYNATGLTDIGSIDSLNTDSLNFGSVNSLDTYTTSQNAAYASNAVDASSADIVEQLKMLNDNLIAWREASSKTEIYMDTGALVGEVVEPLDKELGRRSKLKANRGV